MTFYRNNLRQPREIQPGEFQSFLTTLSAIEKLQAKRQAKPPEKRA